MAMSNEQKLDTLWKEIDNLVDLLVKVDEGSEPVDTLTGQKQKVLDLLPVTPDDGRDDGTYPMHKLLSCRPLTKTEIPLDVITKLIESGFDLNSLCQKHSSMNFIKKHTCLNLAIHNCHYDAVRCLVQHGADCDKPSTSWKAIDKVTMPIAQLAYNANAPLDLFHLLATPKSLTKDYPIPLEIAINEGHTENALCLIKLGSPKRSSLIPNYLRGYSTQYNDELFTLLIPSEPHAIFKCVDRLLDTLDPFYNDSDDESDSEEESEENEVKYKMLNRLFQYIIQTDQMSICFGENSDWEEIVIKMNNVIFCECYSVQPVYWWCLLLVNLGWRYKLTPQSVVPLLPASASEKDVQLAHRIDNIWKTYRDTCISLQNLCIQQTRSSMRDFWEQSFMSLPVPNKLRKLLMYQHVAEIACEAVSCKLKIL